MHCTNRDFQLTTRTKTYTNSIITFFFTDYSWFGSLFHDGFCCGPNGNMILSTGVCMPNYMLLQSSIILNFELRMKFPYLAEREVLWLSGLMTVVAYVVLLCFCCLECGFIVSHNRCFEGHWFSLCLWNGVAWNECDANQQRWWPSQKHLFALRYLNRSFIFLVYKFAYYYDYVIVWCWSERSDIVHMKSSLLKVNTIVSRDISWLVVMNDVHSCQWFLRSIAFLMFNTSFLIFSFC